jgi:hypothetical protein
MDPLPTDALSPMWLSVYPNPTSGELLITSYELQVTNIEVFDIFGKKLSSHTAHHTPHTAINISHLAPGIYLLKINTEVIKIIKQ